MSRNGLSAGWAGLGFPNRCEPGAAVRVDGKGLPEGAGLGASVRLGVFAGVGSYLFRLRTVPWRWMNRVVRGKWRASHVMALQCPVMTASGFRL